MEKYIRESDAIQTVLDKPDMTEDEKLSVVLRLKAVPAADVVEVVRCYECAYHDDDSLYHYCRKWRKSCPDDSEFYCKWGKRKNGGQEA